jgi:fucose 4-O-acetylase-like acetyltransferase
MILLGNIFTLSYPMGNNRIALYDFIRGIAMLFVLLHHAVMPAWRYLVVFHMPLFFFLSGFVSSKKELPTFDRYCMTRFKRLMIPYFAFGMVDIITHTCLDILIYHQGYSTFRGIIGLLTCQLEPWGGIGIYWFLYTIFVADLFIYPLNKYTKNNFMAKFLATIIMLFLSYCSSHWIDLSLFSLDKAFMAAAFILIGGLCKPFSEVLMEQRFKWSHIVLIIIGLLGVYISKLMNPQLVLMYINQYGDYFWFLVGATAGIVASVLIGKYLFMLLRKNEGFVYRLFMWMGFNSLVLFPVHLLIKEYFGVSLRSLGLLLGISHWMLLFLSFIIIGIPMSNFISNYVPWLLGQRKVART